MIISMYPRIKNLETKHKFAVLQLICFSCLRGVIPLLQRKTTVLHRWRGEGMPSALLRRKTTVLCRKALDHLLCHAAAMSDV